MSYLTDAEFKAVGADRAKQPNLVARDMLVRIDQLAVLPHVVFKVLELSGSQDTAATAMEAAITVDPAFSAKLLALANSSYYGLSRKVTSIRDALVYLGFKAVREMAMTAGVFDMFVGKNDRESLRRRAWWRQSLDTAICCQWVANKTHKLDPAEAYTCGLLHYIGKTLLDKCAEPDYIAVEQRIAVGTSDLMAEQRTFGCDHQDVAVEAGIKWGLPPGVIAGFRYQDPPCADEAFKYHRACVALSHAIAKLAVDGLMEDLLTSDNLPLWALDVLEIPRDQAAEILDQGMQTVAGSSKLQF